MNYSKIASLLGALAICLGAFGAHALTELLTEKQLSIYEKAVFYHLTHTILLFVLANQTPNSFSWSKRFLLSGIILFSGSLYLLVLTNTSWFGAITPLGGVCLIFGWLTLFKKQIN